MWGVRETMHRAMGRVVARGLVAGITAVGVWTAAGPTAAQEISPKAKSGNTSAVAQDITVTQDLLNRAGADGNNFLHDQWDYRQPRYYPNRQINPSNVGHLHPAWIFQTDVKELLETSPMIVNGIVRHRPRSSHVYALDARTGAEIWHYMHKLGPITTFCCGPNNRGVAV